jgi:hypothetical protein
LDLSAYVSQKAREQANTERFPVENADDLFRSPYAPKRAEAATTPQPVENSAEVLRSPYAPKTQQQMRPAPEPGDLAGHAEDPHAPEAPRGPSGVERHALGFEETQRQSYDAPAGARPFSSVPGSPDLSPNMTFEEVVKEHPIDLDAAASLQPAHPTSERYEPPAAPHPDEVMNDRDLERLEASLRWLQRQDTTSNTRLPRAVPLAAVRGLPPADARDRHPIVDRRPGGDRHPVGDGYGARVPLSLEPERMAPPPRGTRHDSLRWPLRLLIASSVAAPVLYYLSVGWGPASEPASPSQITAASPAPAVPPAAAKGQREASWLQQDDVPTTLTARGDMLQQPANVPPPIPQAPIQQAPIQQAPIQQAPQLQASPPPQPVQPPTRAPERETVAKLPVAAPAAEAPSRPARTLSQDDIVLLIKQGEQFIAAGDVVTARIVFQRAAESGDPNAAVALGATYDPTVLARLGVVGMGADVEKARSWYQKAESLGSPEAARRLKILANR